LAGALGTGAGEFIFMRVITIDGPAGSGKSTVSQLVALELGWIYITTGAIYRTLALLLYEAGVLEDSQDMPLAIERFVAFLNERYRQESKSGRVFLGDREITSEIKGPFISDKASYIAQNETVRRKLLPLQRKVVLECNGAVVDGRDMGTVVFPDAPLKFFLTASAEERARRRVEELKKIGQFMSKNELQKEILDRDKRDSERKVAPMTPAHDAIGLDCTLLSPEQVVKTILKYSIERGLLPLLNQ
jgi:CMP/dCMP kinase